MVFTVKSTISFVVLASLTVTVCKASSLRQRSNEALPREMLWLLLGQPWMPCAYDDDCAGAYVPNEVQCYLDRQPLESAPACRCRDISNHRTDQPGFCWLNYKNLATNTVQQTACSRVPSVC